TDARNLAACLRQFLDVQVVDDPPRVRLPGRDVRVLVLPVGIDAARFRAQAADAAIRAQAARLRTNLGTEIVCLGVDRLDYTKGIIERLLGFEAFLERHPSWRGRVGLLQITVPSRFRVPDYREMKRTIDETVGRIVGRFTHEGRAPLSYAYTTVDHEELAAYYVAAGEALLVNPWDAQAIRRQIDLAVSMTAAERRRRMTALAAKVAAHDVRWWTTSFLAALAGDASKVEHDRPGLA